MKKNVFSLLAAASVMTMAAMSAEAATYTVYDSTTNPGTWTGGNTGYTTEVTVDGHVFTLETAKGASTSNCVDPTKYKTWRVYKNSQFTIASTDLVMKSIVITFDNGYGYDLELPAGWSGTLNDLVYTVTSTEGSSSVTFASPNGQSRINNITVEAEAGGETPVDPDPIVPDPVPGSDKVMVFDSENPSTWTGDAQGYTTDVTVDGHSFTLKSEKGTSTNSCVNPTQYSSWRIYSGATISIAAADMTMKTIVITYDDASSNKYVKTMALPEGWTGSLEGNVYTITSTEGASSVTLTSDQAQVRIKSIEVSGEDNGGVPPVNPDPIVPDPVPSTGTFTVFDITAPTVWTGGAQGYTTEVTVDGHVFTLESAKAASITDCISPVNNTSSWRVYKNSQFSITAADLTMRTIVITYDGSNYAKALTLPAGWTGTLEGMTYTITSAEGASSVTFGADNAQVRIKNITVSDGCGSTPVIPELPAVKSVAETIALANNAEVKVDYTLTVAFKNKQNVFAVDANGDFIQVYGSNEYEVNDVIPAGWNAQYKLYNNTTPELVPTSSLPASTSQNTFVPQNISDASVLSTDMVNEVVVLKGVVFDTDTPDAKENFTGMMGETELSFRNNYDLEGVSAGKYDVKVVCTIYQNTLSLYVIEYTKDTTVGVEAVEAADAEAVYFNLHGVKVANPENGMFIKVTGNKAEKVVIR